LYAAADYSKKKKGQQWANGGRPLSVVGDLSLLSDDFYLVAILDEKRARNWACEARSIDGIYRQVRGRDRESLTDPSPGGSALSVVVSISYSPSGAGRVGSGRLEFMHDPLGLEAPRSVQHMARAPLGFLQQAIVVL
jgi:hypothetical protein